LSGGPPGAKQQAYIVNFSLSVNLFCCAQSTIRIRTHLGTDLDLGKLYESEQAQICYTGIHTGKDSNNKVPRY
jgi:hypothetical protein